MTKIRNKRYREFLDQGLITTLNESDILQALKLIDGEHIKEGRALLIIAYYTGARPTEYLKLKPKHITKKGSYCVVMMPASKGGKTRVIYLQLKRPLIKEFYQFACTIFDGVFLFYHYRTHYVRKIETKDGIKERIDVTDGLRYHFKKWFRDEKITPYFLRHNRFSKLSESGATAEEIRQMKGSKTLESVFPYLHLSKRTAKKLARKLD